MSNQDHSFTLKKADATSTSIVPNNVYKKRKKLNLSNELIGGIMQFKRMMMVSQQKNDKSSGLDVTGTETVQKPAECRGNTGGGGGGDTKRLLQHGLTALQNVIVREWGHKRVNVDDLVARVSELDALDRAKLEHLDDLERFGAEEDRVIESLRAHVERAHEANEARRLLQPQDSGDVPPPEDRKRPPPPPPDGRVETLSETVDEFRSLCDRAAGQLVTRRSGRSSTHAAVASTVAALRSDVRAFAADIGRAETVDARRPRKADVVRMVTRQLPLEDVRRSVAAGVADRLMAIVDRLQDGEGGVRGINDFLALCYVMKIVLENNRSLEEAAAELDDEMGTLQTSLSDLTAECMALDASKSEKKCESVVLDEFCAVTEEITVQHIRQLEFGRMFTEDDEQISEKLNKIEQLKATIFRKKSKKQMLLSKTESIREQLDVFKYQYDDLARRKASLAEDLISAKRSPGKLADQRDFLVEQRQKHLKQLRVQYGKLTNKRDALKLKLQKHQLVAKTTSKSD